VGEGKVTNRFEKEMQVDKCSNMVVYSGDMAFNLKNNLTLSLIADILDIRYFESMREMEGGTYGVSTRSTLNNIPVQQALLQFTFDTDPKLEDRLLVLIREEIDKLIKEGPLDSDFNKVKENLRNKYSENQKENSWVLSVLFSYYRYGINYYKDYLPTLDSITKEDISTTLKSIIDQNNEVRVIMSAKK
jgi:zinc protease